MKDIAALIRQITSRYIDAGYITSRVYIPEQNIKQTKRLRLVVLEGKVEAIQFAKTVNGKSVNGKTVKGKTVKDKTVKGQSINNQQVEAPPRNTGEASQIAMAFPGLINRPLNLRDIEQGIDQLNRLASNNARLKIEPGSKQGASLIKLSNQRAKRWGLTTGTAIWGRFLPAG